MGNFDSHLGKLVIIKWEIDFLNQNCLDPLDPDNWTSIGFLAENTAAADTYGLVFSSSSFEYKQGYYGIDGFEEEDVECLTPSNSKESFSNLPQDSLDFMQRMSLDFRTPIFVGPYVGVGVSSLSKANHSTLERTCGTCTNSSLLSMKCTKNGRYLQDLKGTCNQWEQ